MEQFVDGFQFLYHFTNQMEINNAQKLIERL